MAGYAGFDQGGPGDLATGTAVRLRRAGLDLVMTEVERPTAVRRRWPSPSACTTGRCRGGAHRPAGVRKGGGPGRPGAGEIPVLCDPGRKFGRSCPLTGWWTPSWPRETWAPPSPTPPSSWPWGRGSPPGWTATGWWRPSGATILGRLILEGSAIPNTACPATSAATPRSGSSAPLRTACLSPWPPSATGWRRARPWPGGRGGGVRPAHRVVRGMLPAGLAVKQGMKAGDIDPRCEARHCFTVSDKARAIGGGVLRACCILERRRGYGASDPLRRGPRVPGAGPHRQPAGV